MRAQPRLYLIGIDSAPLWLIKQMSSQAKLKSFTKLLKQGNLSEIESTMPPMTGPAWPTIYTGLAPGQHGVPDFFEMHRDYTPDLVFYNHTAAPPFWNRIAQTIGKCLIITPAMDTRLPKDKNIDAITGFPLKSEATSAKLRSLMKKYDFYGEPEIEKEMKAGSMTLEKGSELYAKSIVRRASIAKQLIQTEDYSFAFVCFTETDRMQHASLNNPKYLSYLTPIYARISEFLEWVMERADREEAAVMLISDHGAQPIRNKFLLNSFLIREGFAELKPSIKLAESDAKQAASIRYGLREKLLTTRLRKAYDKMPHKLKKAVFSASGKLFSEGSGGTYTHIHLYDLEMQHTKAFAAISNLVVGTIWINDSRFESPGVSASQKAHVLNQLIHKLKAVKSLEGDNLFTEVKAAAPYYGARPKFLAPDIFVVAKPGYTIDVKFASKSYDFQAPELFKSGDHTSMGIIGSYGNIKINTKAINLINVAPTILDYYGFTGAAVRNSRLKHK